MAKSHHKPFLIVTTDAYQKIDWNDMDWYEDIFDVFDDNCDVLEYTTTELNRYFTSSRLSSVIDQEEEEEMLENNNLIVNDDIGSTIDVQEDDEEEALSQKLSQLSTRNEDQDQEEEEECTVTSQKRHLSESWSSDVIPKKIKLTDANDGLNNGSGGGGGGNDNDHIKEGQQDKIPDYLLTTDQSFIEMIQKVMDTASSLKMDELRYMAILVHQIADFNIQKQITTTYLQSGIGQLREPEFDLTEIDRRVWPQQVKSAMLKTRPTILTDITIHQNENNEQLQYENLVQKRLQELTRKIQQCQAQYSEKKSRLIGFTSTIEEGIHKYVQQHGITPLQMKRDLKIALLEHDYDAEILERRYLAENPNEYHIEVAQCLCQAKYHLEKCKRSVLELKRRVFYNKPPDSFDSINVLLPASTTAAQVTTNNNNMQAHLVNQQHKQLIRQKKLDLIGIYIAKAEVNYHEAENTFNAEYRKMQENHLNLVKNKGMPTTLGNLIEKRLKNITDRRCDIYHYTVNYYLRSSYGDLENMRKNKANKQNKDNTKNISFLPPYLISDTTHRLTDKQIQLLLRGPTYVPPCQIYLSSSFSSIDKIIEKQYAPLKRQLATLFTKHHINIALSWEIQLQINGKFTRCFSLPIPSDIRRRATYENKLVQSIRTYLDKNNNLILRRTADNQNTFYLGDREQFEIRANQYLAQNDAYQLLTTITNEHDEQNMCDNLKKKVEVMNNALGILRRRQALPQDVINKLLSNASKVKLPYLYFLPDVSKTTEITLVPRIVSEHSATSKIGHYIYQLIRPFTDQKLRTVTFHDEADFMHKLNYYSYEQPRLRPTTRFCTLKITNFYTLNTHRTMIDTVICFLRDKTAISSMGQISIMTIQNLLELFLFYNTFSYGNKIYTIMKGSPHTMALTALLSNIYLFDWQQLILKELKGNNELFGRYKDEIFFTWNESDDVLRSYLQSVQTRLSSVHFQITIGSSVRFFDAYIENRAGQLYSRVFHDPSIQRYILPYVIGPPKVRYGDWLRAALLRAVCYCSTVEDFHRERIYLELTCLVNGYSFYFVESHVQHFFDYIKVEGMRYRSDQTKYHSFRSHWFDFLDMQRTESVIFQKQDDNGKVLRFNYLYNYGPRCQFNEDFYEIWSKYFQNHTVLSPDKVKIILTTKDPYSLNAFLVQHKPLYRTREQT